MFGLQCIKLIAEQECVKMCLTGSHIKIKPAIYSCLIILKIITETQGAYYLQKQSHFSIQEFPVFPVRMVSTYYRHIRPVYYIYRMNFAPLGCQTKQSVFNTCSCLEHPLRFWILCRYRLLTSLITIVTN